LKTTINSDKIQNCEIEYSRCFCKTVEQQNYIRFRDDLLKDMYSHNFTLIKHSNSDDEFHKLVEDEILLRKAEGSDFCNIVSFVPVSEFLLQKFDIKPEISVNGFYLFDSSKLSELKIRQNDCVISKISDQAMINDSLSIELDVFGDIMSNDFLTRKSNIRKEVYFSPESLNSYICYENGESIGACDLFVYKDTAKIEDFSVSIKKQRQGYGTVILKSIIETALNSNASTIYLVTDEDDTAKEMYLKCGFKKIGIKTDLFFKL